MLTDWRKLATKIGSLHEDDSETGGDLYAQQALDEILGDEWIRQSVEHILSFHPGYELAMNCLRYLQSVKATSYAYEIYKQSNGERARQATWLIKHIAHPIAYNWVEEFLNDPNVIQSGLGLLDQLLWTARIPFDDKAKSLLELAERNSNGQLREHTDFIRQYLEGRNDPD